MATKWTSHVRKVPADLERNVELPATEAAGRPTDEERTTNRERRVRMGDQKRGADRANNGGCANLEGSQEKSDAKAIDRPSICHTVSQPQAKN